jgi:hypothetical protein
VAEPPAPATATTPDAAAAVAQSRTGDSAVAARASRGPAAPGPGFTLGPGVARGARATAYERKAGDPIYRPLWIYTIDPAASRQEGATSIINVPFEPLRPGPEGAVLKVVPRDVETGDEYKVLAPDALDVLIGSGRSPSPADPRFHQQMVYAVCAEVYAAFQRALGRPVAWGFERSSSLDDPDGTHLLLFPHGGSHRNAFYDPVTGALYFGYFMADEHVTGRNVPGGFIFTCLTHDIVAHEMTHALLDGLRTHFSVPTSGDVLGFHEGFADVIAILQHFSYPEVVRAAIAKTRGSVTQASVLLDLARQFGHTTGSKRALRSALQFSEKGEVVPRRYEPHLEQHEMGSVLVSAVFDAFLTIFFRKVGRYVRLATNGTGVLPPHELPPDLQAVLSEEASTLASQFLSICIRAIDYCPPVDLSLGEYLRALITADYDLVPSDPWGYREAWIEAFSRHGIYPPNMRTLAEDELRWRAPEPEIPLEPELSFARLQFVGDPGAPAGEAELTRQAQRIGDMVTRHLSQFGLMDPRDAGPGEQVDLPCVQSVRSCRRVGPDSQVVFDLVAEVTQRRTVHHEDGDFTVFGGATVLIGPKGDVRYVIAKNIRNEERAQRHREFALGPGRAFYPAGPADHAEARRNMFRLLDEGQRSAAADAYGRSETNFGTA